MQRVTEKEKEYVLEVLGGEFRNSDTGRMVQRFEETFAKTFGVRFALSQVNGTTTLHSALVAAGIGEGDEVIVPPLTMASTCFAVLQSGANPVFADVDPETFNIDPQDIARKITPKTKAIMPVCLFGLPVDFDPIMALAKEHQLFVLEDDAQCFLGKYKGQLVGTIGQAASFSFQTSKHLTCGEGGVVVTNDEELADKIRCFSSLGYQSVKADPAKAKVTREQIQHPDYLRHKWVGFNYRMADLCAAAALAQTERIEELVQARQDSAAIFEEAREGCSWLRPQKVPQDYVHSYWTYVVALENGGEFSWSDFRKKYIEFGGDGIYAAWQLNYLEPALRGKDFGTGQAWEKGLCPVAERLQPKLLQFKTNYYDLNEARMKAQALRKTIHYFEG